MSDFDGDYTEFPNSLRWNAEAGTLSVSAYDLEAGGRELKEILLGALAGWIRWWRCGRKISRQWTRMHANLTKRVWILTVQHQA